MSIDKLTAEDQLMLGARDIRPQDISAIALVDSGNRLAPTGLFRIETMLEAFQSRGLSGWVHYPTRDGSTPVSTPIETRGLSSRPSRRACATMARTRRVDVSRVGP